MAEVDVKLEDRSYKIYIDAANRRMISKALQELKINKKILMISDDNVGASYGCELVNILSEDGFSVQLYCVPAGEPSKNLDMAMNLYTKAIQLGLDRKSAIIALGGGVIGDLSGFVAATYLRGIPFIQIPTSLLAQVDSSVGGKVAVNHPMGKNLIGAFYQPRSVIVDVDFLRTLPARELYTGLAEVIKYGVIADKTFFTYLNANITEILDKNPAVLTEIVRRSCEIKAQVVEQDERESSIRAILNFGHTIGHAIEANTGFTIYNHGEAVAIGMYGAALISNCLGMCSKETVHSLRQTIINFKLPIAAPECQADVLLELLSRDKKVIDAKINWVLMNDIGQVSICNDVPEDIVKSVLMKITKNGN